MTDAPERTPCGHKVYTMIGIVEVDPRVPCPKCKVAALEQERNEANQACREFVELKLEQRGRAIVAEDEAARLREAIRERDIDLQGLVECARLITSVPGWRPDYAQHKALQVHIERVNELRALADPEGGSDGQE